MSLLPLHMHRKTSPIKSLTKTVCLSTVSPAVVWFVCDGCPGGGAGSSGGYNRHDDNTAGIWAFWVWVRLWLDWLRGGGARSDTEQAAHSDLPNRKTRRIKWRKIPSLLNLSLYHQLLGRGLSPAQFLDRVSRISPLGRLRLMRIWQWATKQQYQAMLTCYDLGWWRAPLGVFGRVYCGVWQVHMWPEWLWWFSNKGNDAN